MGYERGTTPHMDSLATDGVVYTNAMSPASRTPYSVSGMFTGEHLTIQDEVSNPIYTRNHLQRFETLAERLSEKGYQTAAFCPSMYASSYYGFDEGFDYYRDFLSDDSLYMNILKKHLQDTSASGLVTNLRNFRNFVFREETFKTWDKYINEIESWAANAADEPFFLWIFAQEPHIPYLIPRQHRKWVNLYDVYKYNWIANSLIDDLSPNPSEKTKQKLIDIYDNAVYYGDQLIHRITEVFDEFNPVTMVTADHGEAFFEHDVYGHFYPEAYEENVHVPFVISGTDGEPRTIDKPFSLTTLPDIVLDATDGKIDDWSDKFAVSTEYDARWERRVLSIRGVEEKYIAKTQKESIVEEYYNLSEDPQEQTNRIEDAPDEIIEKGLECMNQQLEILRIRNAIDGIEV